MFSAVVCRRSHGCWRRRICRRASVVSGRCAFGRGCSDRGGIAVDDAARTERPVWCWRRLVRDGQAGQRQQQRGALSAAVTPTAPGTKARGLSATCHHAGAAIPPGARAASWYRCEPLASNGNSACPWVS